MGYRYAVIGAGMQGTAAAFDLARFGDADEVRLLDRDLRIAEAAAARVNKLVDRQVAKAGLVSASDKSAAGQVLEGMNACMSCVPFFLNEALTRAAIDAKVHFNDLGGNTAVVMNQLELDASAREAGVSVIPDCGVAPGMANTLAVLGIEKFDRPEHVRIRCGGLPQNRDLPLGYTQLFSMEGLTNEYFGQALVLRDGKVETVGTFEELETIELPEPLGTCEAFVTSGGTSTAPYTWEGKLHSYDYKTIRYPGHYAQMKLLKDLGFIELNVVEVDGHPVVPRHLFHQLMQTVWNRPEERDLLVLRVEVEGLKDGKRMQHRSLVVDYHDEETGFSAMERTTAYSAGIVTAMQARGDIPAGATRLETAVDPERFVAELPKRGISHEASFTEVA